MHGIFRGIRGKSSALCFGLTCFKDGFAMKKILTLAALVAFLTVLGCNDAKTSVSSTKVTKIEEKKDVPAK